MPILKDERIDLRLSSQQKEILNQAALERGLSLSSFLLDAALTEAENQLADRRIFKLSDEHWEAFNEAINDPTEYEKPRLDKLFSEPSVFD
jgi:uncharacterized protein (DUF1778 family)